MLTERHFENGLLVRTVVRHPNGRTHTRFFDDTDRRVAPLRPTPLSLRTLRRGAQAVNGRDMYDCLYNLLQSPTLGVKDDVLSLLNLSCPLTDPTGETDILFTAVAQEPFDGQLDIVRMLVAGGAPVTKRTICCANSKFDNLWNVICPGWTLFSDTVE